MEAEATSPTHWAAPLYDRCAAELVLYGRALGLSHAESEDILHDTFRAAVALPETPREPRFYLVRTFRNRALNHRRTLWRRLNRERLSSDWLEPGPGESPLERRAVEALRLLPPEQREVIVLKIWHELSFDAIASLLDLNPNTAAGRYRYGLQKLRASLHPDSAPDDTATDDLPETAPTAPAPDPGPTRAQHNPGSPGAHLHAALRQTVQCLQPQPAGGPWPGDIPPRLLP